MRLAKIFFAICLLVGIPTFKISAQELSAPAAVIPDPAPCQESGASKTFSVAKGSFVWGEKLSGLSGTNILLVADNTMTLTVNWGCVEPSPNTTFANRKSYLESKYAPKVFACFVGLVADTNCDGSLLPPTATLTASRTATATSTASATRTLTPSRTATSSPTATATRTATRSSTPSATRTATRTATQSPTVTPILVLRTNATYFGSSSRNPAVGQIWWCKSFNGDKNTVRKIAVSYFYPVPVTDCGVQTVAPFDSLDSIKAYLELTTKETWTVVK